MWISFLLVHFLCIEAASLTKNNVTKTLFPALRDLFKNKTTAGAALRLTFHDCAGGGGCDGCLNTNLPDNAGLDGPIQAYEWLYANLSLGNLMSRADLWALGGIVAVSDAMKKGYPNGFVPPALVDPSKFKYGRTDCSTTPWSTDDEPSHFPRANLGTAGVTSYFSSRFDFNAEESVAIMGAHHVGRMYQENSGFNGGWVPAGAMNGTYYRQMMNASAGWHQRVTNCNIEPGDQKVQWIDNRGNPCLNLLDADIALYKDIGTPEFNGAVHCAYATCPYASTANFVSAYASDANLFQQAFAAVYDRMITVCGRTATGAPKVCTGLAIVA